MKGMSERERSTRSGRSRGAVPNAKRGGRSVFYADGSINAAASDVRRTEMNDPDQQQWDRQLPQSPHCTEGLPGAGTPTCDPEEERHADRPGARRSAGVPPGAAGPRCLGHMAGPRNGADRGGGGGGGGKPIGQTGDDRSLHNAAGAGSQCPGAA